MRWHLLVYRGHGRTHPDLVLIDSSSTEMPVPSIQRMMDEDKSIELIAVYHEKGGQARVAFYQERAS